MDKVHGKRWKVHTCKTMNWQRRTEIRKVKHQHNAALDWTTALPKLTLTWVPLILCMRCQPKSTVHPFVMWGRCEVECTPNIPILRMLLLSRLAFCGVSGPISKARVKHLNMKARQQLWIGRFVQISPNVCCSHHLSFLAVRRFSSADSH